MTEPARPRIYSLIYRSFARPPWIAQDALDDISREARAFNARHGLTGVLIFSDGVFVQVLEGDTVDVLSLSARIAADARNDRLRVLWHGNIAERRFADWSMGCFQFPADRQGDAPVDSGILAGDDDIPAWTPEMTERLLQFYAANRRDGLAPLFKEMRRLD